MNTVGVTVRRVHPKGNKGRDRYRNTLIKNRHAKVCRRYYDDINHLKGIPLNEYKMKINIKKTKIMICRKGK